MEGLVATGRRWVLGVLCVAGLLAGCGSTGTGETTSSTGSSSALPAAATQQAGATTTATASSRSSRSRAKRPGPLSALNEYWQSINAHSFGTAYSDLAPSSVPQTEPQFVSDEQQAGIQTATFRGRIASLAGSTATVDVTSLVTDDAQFGCRSWTGSYQLSHQTNRWLISRASITPGPCASAQLASPATSPALTQTGTTPSASPPSSPAVETPGSSSHATDGRFCSTHQCIENFPNGNGYIVQCADGEWSHSGGLSGACSDHGGES